MVCWSSQVYHENRDKEIEEDNNPHYGEPFPGFQGGMCFRACHCPENPPYSALKAEPGCL